MFLLMLRRQLYAYLTWTAWTGALHGDQARACAPIVAALQKMWATRTTPLSGLADGTCSRPVVAVWLGAGGSGKTWSFTQVLRSPFQKSLPPQALLAVAPAHAAGRLLGKDAIALHKAGDAAFRQKWDKESLALKGSSAVPLCRHIPGLGGAVRL